MNFFFSYYKVIFLTFKKKNIKKFKKNYRILKNALIFFRTIVFINFMI